MFSYFYVSFKSERLRESKVLYHLKTIKLNDITVKFVRKKGQLHNGRKKNVVTQKEYNENTSGLKLLARKLMAELLCDKRL